MQDFLNSNGHNLVTPDGYIKKIDYLEEGKAHAEVMIENISPHFSGYKLDPKRVVFNFKSNLAQLGLNGVGVEHFLDKKRGCALVKVELTAIGMLASEMLHYLEEGAYIGKLFARDERRLVHNPDYLVRMFGRSDREGRALLSFGGGDTKKDELILQRVGDHMVAFLKLKPGCIEYAPSIYGFLPTIGRALKQGVRIRELLKLHQIWVGDEQRIVVPGKILLVATEPLHIRTVFARVVDELLPKGYKHTSANILQPDTQASGDIYELFGSATEEITEIPLEFYTLEPLREHVFVSDREELRKRLNEPKTIFHIFDTAPSPEENQAAVFIVKSAQLNRLKTADWVQTPPAPLPPSESTENTEEQVQRIEDYIHQYQPSFPILDAIEKGMITSQGVLFTRYFPTPLLKRKLMSYSVQRVLKGIYFQIPSRTHGAYFSLEDRGMLIDLNTFGIPIYWADGDKLLKYVQRPHKTSGMFVPLDKVEAFQNAAFFGVYGSNLIAADFKSELTKLLTGLLEMQQHVDHPLFNKKTPIALLTGGGPGAMEVGNKIAKEMKLLSCAHIVDFRIPGEYVVEQKANPYVEAKMTYRLDHLVERQGNFYLDFPIFVMGGIGTDFELSLEELRHKVRSRVFTPIILFGSADYWKQKITTRFQCNLESGTIKGSEWISNSFFCIERAEEGLKIYNDYFTGKLPIGPGYPVFQDGFVKKY
jgi:predicted Rossmann-fold nucleotide-binding protein